MYASVIPPVIGGGELYSFNIALEIAKRYPLILVTRGNGKIVSRKRHGPHLEIIRTSALLVPILMLILTIRRKPRIIHVALHDFLTPILLVISKIFGLKAVLTYHGTYLSSEKALRKYRSYQLVFLIDWLILGLPFDVIVAVDNLSQALIKRSFYGTRLQDRPVYLIPSAVNSKMFRPLISMRIRKSLKSLPRNIVSVINEALGEPKDFSLILCPRRIDPKNGIHVLLRSTSFLLKENFNIKVVITGRIGYGVSRYYDYLLSLIHELNLKDSVIFTGNVGHKYMPILYNVSDFIVIPSLAEARSLAALEGMSCGKIVIASKVGGLIELISHGETGFLVEPNDPKMLAEMIAKVIVEKQDLQNIVVQARKYALSQNWSDRAKEYIAIYSKLQKDSN